MKKEYILIILFSLILLVSGCVTSNPPPTPLPTPSPTPLPTPVITPNPDPSTCDDSLWNHVYHPTRLQIIEKCKTITGTVINIANEADGDYHLRLDVDDKSLINQANINGQYGYLIVEPICQHTITQQDAIEPCKEYNGPRFDNINQYIGKHVSIMGSYVSDLDHNGWNEIHPLNDIKTIT